MTRERFGSFARGIEYRGGPRLLEIDRVLKLPPSHGSEGPKREGIGIPPRGSGYGSLFGRANVTLTCRPPIGVAQSEKPSIVSKEGVTILARSLNRAGRPLSLGRIRQQLWGQAGSQKKRWPPVVARPPLDDKPFHSPD